MIEVLYDLQPAGLCRVLMPAISDQFETYTLEGDPDTLLKSKTLDIASRTPLRIYLRRTAACTAPVVLSKCCRISEERLALWCQRDSMFNNLIQMVC